MTVVTAGPGWGKTTTIAAWARRAPERESRPIAWLTLTPMHDSPVPFWNSVLDALSGAEGSPGLPFDVNLMLPQPMLVVLDDFHVITHDDVMTELADLALQSTNVQFLLLTRGATPMPLHRLRLSGSLAEVGASELAFDAAAVCEMAAHAGALNLTSHDANEILAKTEGWPAGVRLAIRSLTRRREGASLTGFTGAEAAVADYFDAEILRRSSEETRQFLLRTSVVDVISGELADAILPGCNGHARLDALHRANQFTVTADPQGTTYRYHPLLREFLLHTLTHREPVALREAHRAAASWFLASRQPIVALGHAVSANDWALATDAFIDASPLILSSQGAVVEEHLRSIPFESLDSTAALALCAAGLEFCRGRFFAMEARLTEARSLIAAGDSLPPVAMAFLENLTCEAAHASGDDAGVEAAAGGALTWISQAPPGAAADGNRLIASTHAAVARLHSGDVAGARTRLTTVVRDASSSNLPLLRLGARAHLAWCDLVDGDLRSAIVHASSLVDEAALDDRATFSQMRMAYVTLAMAHMLKSDLDSADRWVAHALAADANGIERWPTVLTNLARASQAVCRDRPRDATRALAAARSAVLDRPIPPQLADTLTRAGADVALLLGTEVAQIPRAEHGSSSATDWSTRARIALAQGDVEDARRCVNHVNRVPKPIGIDDLLATIEALLCETLIAAREHRMTACSDALTGALDLALPQRITRPFIVMGSTELTRILRATSVPADQLAFRDSLLDSLSASGNGAGDLVLPEPLIEPLTERELAVLAQLPTMRTNEEIARDFHVSINTVKSHLKHLYRKFGVTNRRDAVRRARALALLP